MTDKSNWCRACRDKDHKNCKGHFFRSGRRRACFCPHTKPGESAGELAKRFIALGELQKITEAQIEAHIGVPPELLENNRRVVKIG